jgi:hypothetical protein
MLIEVSDVDDAAQQRFAGSPTIRVNRRDIAPPPTGHEAASLSCRLYATTSALSEVPDISLVRAALQDA